MAETKANKAKDNYQKVYVMNEQNDVGKYIPTVAKGTTVVDGKVDIRSMPAVNVSKQSIFEVGRKYSVVSFNLSAQELTSVIQVISVRDAWIEVRNTNASGSPINSAFWFNTVWIRTARMVPQAKTTRSKTAKSK